MNGLPNFPKLPLYPYNGGKKKHKGQAATDADGWAWWRRVEGEPWQQAVFHSVLRSALIAEAARQGTYMNWTVSKDRTCSRGDYGPLGPQDVTSFEPRQDWTGDRALSRGIFNLDFKWHPLLNFRSLPHTISSKEYGCFLEGIF